MKKMLALLTMLSFSLALVPTVFAADVKAEKNGRPKMTRRGAPGMPGRTGERERGWEMALMYFPAEAQAVEKQRMALIEKAEVQEKAFREKVARYRSTKDAALLADIKAEFGKRFDTRISMMKTRIAEMEKNVSKDERGAKMLERMKDNLEKMTASGREKFIEQQLKRMTSEKSMKGKHSGQKGKPRQH